MTGMNVGMLAEAGPIIVSTIRTIGRALGVFDDTEKIVVEIDKYMPRALEIMNDFARAEMVKAQAQMITAEAALARECRELLQVRLEIIRAESAREYNKARSLEEQYTLQTKALERDIDRTVAQILRLLDGSLKQSMPNYVDAVEKPLLRLMPPSKAS